MPFPTEENDADELDRGELLVAVQFAEREKAYPMRLLRKQNPVSDRVYNDEVLVVVAADDRSVRAFNRRLDDETLEMYRKADTEELVLIDGNTGSEWDFTGTAISGPLAGRTLERFPVYTDFFFDWRAFHPDDPVYVAGDF